ncbi:MAG: hypothetical protein P4M09_01345 [Devosia sp.]|nr:hypothetical protein [Devosia sp.]
MTPSRAALLLSTQRALLGAVGPSWRAVWVGLSDNVFHFHAVIDEQANEEDREASRTATSELCADFPQIGSVWALDEEPWIARQSEPVPYAEKLELAFLRRGETIGRLSS